MGEKPYTEEWWKRRAIQAETKLDDMTKHRDAWREWGRAWTTFGAIKPDFEPANRLEWE